MREIDTLMRHFRAARLAGHASALASVVHVEGSSYRKPGARMLVTAAGTVAGAVSGGCVERAVAARARRVLGSGLPEMMVYDGRHRLGCDGSLHILVEPLAPAGADGLLTAYDATLGGARERTAFAIHSAFAKTPTSRTATEEASPTDLPHAALGSVFDFGAAGSFAARSDFALAFAREAGAAVHTQRVEPARRLFVVGAERDAVVLARLGAAQAWDTTLVTHPRNPLAPEDGLRVVPVDPHELAGFVEADARTAVVLMSHNFARDLAYLAALARGAEQPRDAPAYLGLLGPAQRRRRLLDELADLVPPPPEWLDERVYGPAGLDLGAELPEGIALSIMAEITAAFAGRPVPSLRDKRGRIHEPADA